MGELLAVVVLIALVGLCALATATAVAVLLARRVVLEMSRLGGSLALRATSYGVGPRSEAAGLRLDLRGELDAARRAVAVARAQGWPLGDAPALVARLDRAGAGIDARLRTVAAEPSRAVAVRALAEARAEAQTVGHAARALREALLASGSALERPEVRSLGADCALEARALRSR